MVIRGKSSEDVATRDSWGKLKPMPKRYTTVPLDFVLNEKQAIRLRQGFIPSVEEEKWFAFFEDNTLYQHRSWTGICIDQIHFVIEGNGLRATHAEVNRHTPHYSNKDDQEDIDRITNMVIELSNLSLGAKSKATDSMVKALEEALKQNYLGSPEVIHALLIPFFDAQISLWRCLVEKKPTKEAREQLEEAERTLRHALSGNDPNYVTMPWHSVEQLGQTAIRYFDLDRDYCAGESLDFILLESFAAISMLVSDLLRKFVYGEEHNWDRDVAPNLEKIIKFTETVLLGTNALFYPNETLRTIISKNSLQGIQSLHELRS